jgi:predicted Ser/Thr protein kinase
MIFGIIKFTRFLYSLQRAFKKKSTQNINYLVENTKRCGPLAIKLLQYILMNHDFGDASLDFVFEENKVHSLPQTLKMYRDEFGVSLSDHMTNIQIIASGSIGQVYSAYCRKRKCYVAIKVKHPDAGREIYRFTKIVKFVCWVTRTFNKFSILILEYINTLESQLDYIKEAANTTQLHNNWRDNDLIIIPEVFSASNNFIITSYHEGLNYNKLTVEQQQLSGLYMNLFVLQCLLIDDFLHSDLHTGNWKVKIDNGKLKIIIYDCGLICKSGSTSYNKEIISNLLSGNFHDLVYTVAGKSKKSILCSNFIKANLPDTTVKRTRFFINTILSWGIVSDTRFISVLTAFGIIGEICGTGTNVFTSYISDINLYQNMIYIYIHLLKKSNSFVKLRIFFEEWMDSNPENLLNYNKWLFERFGHTKGYILHDIIYSKFKIA